MNNAEIAAHINALSGFLGMRDVAALTPQCLLERTGQPCVDIMVLFGGSILAGGDVLARAMQTGAARKYAIVGGEGHTTQALRDRVHALYPDFDTNGLPEARVFAGYLERRYGLVPDMLECESTNCGNNITNMLRMLDMYGVRHRSIILCQDASMQRRMDAGLRLHAPGTRTVNFAAYRTSVIERDGGLAYSYEPAGMWSMERFISLLMSEIPRLTDAESGYGPCGNGFIAHVDIPDEVRRAFDALNECDAGTLRAGNSRYAG